MYAILALGGKQYRVRQGSILNIEKIEKEIGSEIEFSEILMSSHEGKVDVGCPRLEGIKVYGRVLEHIKGKKVIVFKYKKRKRYSRKHGHRQRYTKILISKIEIL